MNDLFYPTVLVAEDDPALRALAAAALEDLGIQVRTAGSADEAYALLKAERFSLLLTDVVMPGALDGWELSWLAHELDPAMALIVTSGYHDRLNDKLPPGAVFLPKPWTLDRLYALVGGGEQVSA
ncbi:response regulator [Pseudomonas sp. Marseille-Q5115]|uniref:response regulator n=1 Tax=Pseudomonas sp. Marseille-Q5115 TaxID=2866593 RepID=UPI001CE4A075|nr:response regulator [Pseudomonas sp. Marseille-Q5115]